MRKKNCFTKALAVFLTALMLLSVAPLAAMSDVLPKLDLDFDLGATAHAEGGTSYLTSGYCGDTSDGQDGKNIAWSLDADGTLTLTGTGKMGSTPNREDNRVTKVIVGEGITEIADYAFANCDYLLEVHFPSTLRFTGNNSFYRDKALVTVDLPNAVSIGDNCFYECEQMVIDSLPEELESIGECAFFNCHAVSSISFPSGITSIGSGAFSGSGLLQVSIPASIESLPSACFRNAPLTSVELHQNIKEIGSSCFSGTNITDIDLPESLETLGNYAFCLCTELESIDIPASCEVIGAYAFASCTSLSSVVFHEGLKQIDSYAFSKKEANMRNNISSVSFPSSLETIGDYAFYDSFFLASIDFGNGVQTIGQHAFDSCGRCNQTIVFPDSCVSVGTDAFSNTNASGFYLGSGLSSFGASQNMRFLTSIDVSAQNQHYASYDGVLYTKDFSTLIQIPNKTVINIPAEFKKQSGLFLSTWSNLSYVNVDEANPFYKSVNGIIYSKDGTTVLECPKAYSGAVVIADSAVEIGQRAFQACKSITSIQFNDALKTIGRNAFSGCTGLSGLEIPGSVETIGDEAFAGCLVLKSIVLNEGLKTIGRRAFSPSEFSSGIIFLQSQLESIAIPDSVEYIGESAFENNKNLKSVSLGNGVIEIAQGAFNNCTKLTGELVIPDSCERIGYNSFSNTDITSIYIGSGLNGFGTLSGLDSLLQIEVSPENTAYASYDGVMYSRDLKTLLLMPAKETLKLPAPFQIASTQFGNLMANWPFIKAIDVDEQSPYYSASNGILYSKNGEELICCPVSFSGAVVIKEGTKEIGPFAFYDCKGITEVSFPDTVQTICMWAFANCNALTRLRFPESLRDIERAAFEYCNRIASIEFNEGLKNIGDEAFRISFSTVGSLTRVELPDSLDYIGSSAFSGQKNLEEVYMGNGIDYLSYYVFGSCSAIREFHLSEKLQSIEMPYEATNLKKIVVPNRYMVFKNNAYINPSSSGGTIYGYCGSPAHETAVKRLFAFQSLGHTYLDWYVFEAADYNQSGIERRDCAYCGESETRVIPKLERDIYTATFVADGKVVASVDYQKGTTAIDEPAVPARDRYTGKWEDYTLNDADLTINAVYTLIKSDDAQEIETESSVEHWTEKDNVLFHVKATSAAKIVKSVVSQSIPLDIVLVVDQSGSMEDTLGGATKKVDALKAAANSFIDAVADNARLTGAAHRIAIAGFGLAGTYSGYQPYENTELLTGANGTVNYLNVTPADYASALLPVLNGAETNAALTSAVAAIEARGATAADLGLEMAKGIFANTDSTGRDRVVVFMTDGEPTYQSSFQKEVANNAVYNASLLKNAYDALVYSVGIFDQSESENRKIKSFMNAVSSNYPGAKTYTNLGASASDVFSITASHTDALNGVFKTITTESLSHTVPFENVTLIKTLAPCVTLTAPQEETLRIDVIRKYGISNDQIHITRDDQGRTEIRIDGLTPYEVTDKDGNVSYEVAIEFFAALNEHASAAGDYTVDTEDSGIMLGDDALGYEATFDTNSLNLLAQKTRYIFTINGEIYEIAEGSTVAAAVPETDFAADWQFSGWNTTGVSNANGTIIDATLVKAPRTVTWHTADGDTTQVYTEGQFLNPPEVPDRADGSKFLSWDKSLPTVMLDRDLEFTAVYGPHIHRYVSELTKKATCTEDGLLTYTCICGDSYTEPVTATGHNYEAITATGDSDPTRCTFVCTNCGDKYEYALNYKVEDRSFWGSRTVYEFALTDDNLETGMQPDGSIDVRIPLNEFQSTATRVKVQRYVNGKWETVPAALEDGYLVITADHFTPYEVQFTFSCNETGEHTWDQGKETKAATCTEEGEMTYTCETCESTKTEPIGKKDHTPGAWIVDKAATCKEAGSKHQECTVCHNTIATETIAVDKTNHASYGTTLKNKVDANCTTKGYTGDAVCNGCGTVINKGNETAALGHTAPNSKGNCDRCGTHLKDVDSGSSTPAGACKYCGQVHTGPFGWLIKFFHSILALFGLHK